jgi:hypothetical protein
MKKFFYIALILFFIGAGFVLVRLYVKSPESFRILVGCPTELPLRDNSALVQYIPPGKPKVTVVTVDIEKLMSEARIKYMRNRRAEAKKFVEYMKGLNRPTATVVNISTFGGKKDDHLKEGETASISGLVLSSINTKVVGGMAWFMPDYSEENPKSPIKVPSVETWLGGDGKTLKQRIENANKALKNYFVEVTVLDEKGHIVSGPHFVEPHDRGPSTEFEKPRADMFEKTCVDLGILDYANKPNCENHRVNLVMRLVPKSEVLFSESGGEEFQLPSWGSGASVASNP